MLTGILMSLKDAIVLITSTFSEVYVENDYDINERFPKLTKSFENMADFLTFDFRRILSKDENSQNKIIETSFDNTHRLFSFLSRYYRLIFDFNNINGDAKKYDVIDVGGIPVAEMEMEWTVLNQICTYIKEKNLDHRSIECSLFLFRDYSYLNKIFTSRKLISEIGSEKIKLCGVGFEKIKQKFKNKNQFKEVNIENHETKSSVFSLECSQDWYTKIFIPKSSLYEKDGCNGRLANLKLGGGKNLKTVLINQFKDAMLLKFLENMTFFVKNNLEKILNQKGIFKCITAESLIPILKSTRIFKSNISYDDCLISSGIDFQTLVLSKFATDFHDRHNYKKSYKQFFRTLNSLNKISDSWKSISRENESTRIKKFNQKITIELKSCMSQIFQDIGCENVFSIFDDANQMSDRFKMLNCVYSIQNDFKSPISIKDKHYLIYNSKFQNIINKSIILKFGIQVDNKNNKEYLKYLLDALEESQFDTISCFEGYKKQLFLKTLILEFEFGSFGQIKEKIQSFSETFFPLFD